MTLRLDGVYAISYSPGGAETKATPTDRVIFTWDKVTETDNIGGNRFCYDRVLNQFR